VFLKALEELFIDRMDQNEEITAKFMNDKEFQEALGSTCSKKFMSKSELKDPPLISSDPAVMLVRRWGRLVNRNRFGFCGI
jgi:type I restriction enzyme R subunit